MLWAPIAERYCHKHCLLAEAASDPWREPIFSLVYQCGMFRQVPGYPPVACRRGHKLTPENILPRRQDGREYRKCRTCERERRRRGRAAKAAADCRRRAREPLKQANWERTHCRNGHTYTPETIVIGGHGEKKCRECLRAAGHKAWDRRWGGRAGQETALGAESTHDSL